MMHRTGLKNIGAYAPNMVLGIPTLFLMLNTVCIDGSALTNEGWTSLTPATLLASKGSLPQGRYISSVPGSVEAGIFSGAGSLSSSTSNPKEKALRIDKFCSCM
jgi:hypothetical protein